MVVLDEPEDEDSVPSQVGGLDLLGRPRDLREREKPGPPERQPDEGQPVAGEDAPDPEAERDRVEGQDEGEEEPDDREDLLVEDVDGQDAAADVGAQAALDGRADLAQGLEGEAGRVPPVAVGGNSGKRRLHMRRDRHGKPQF